MDEKASAGNGRQGEVAASPPCRLAQMPNGEAFRADRVAAVRIVEEVPLVGAERLRFAVVVELVDGSCCTIDGDLARRDAEALARLATREVNDQLLASRAEPLA